MYSNDALTMHFVDILYKQLWQTNDIFYIFSEKTHLNVTL